MPDMHGSRDISKAKPPRAEVEPYVLHGCSRCGRRQGSREIITHRGTDLWAGENGHITGQGAPHPCQRGVGCPLLLAQASHKREFHEPGYHGHQALHDAVGEHHVAVFEIGLGWRAAH